MSVFRCAGITSRWGEGRCCHRVRAKVEPAYCEQHRPGRKGRIAALVAAKKAVKDAAMAWWRTAYDDPRAGDAFDAACAALAALAPLLKPV